MILSVNVKDIVMKENVTDFMGRCQSLSVHCEMKSLNKGYFRLHILSRPDIKDIYCNIF